ncbi:hypothetical protein NKJ51_12275 [Mesorhizobium sp. M0134]|uniref:hypothetical protein n=1 Tax=Mesorhizobium sp. M0134 TaxID=2956889 RepID=UPI00333C053B
MSNHPNLVGTVAEIDANFLHCAEITNLGTINPKLLNNCGTQKTIKVLNWDRNGRLVATRWFHLEDGRERPIAFPGYQMAISAVTDFADMGGDDGSRFLDTPKHTVPGFEWWEATNTHPERWNAVSFSAFHGTTKRLDVTYALAPGERINIWGDADINQPFFALNWARLDPL